MVGKEDTAILCSRKDSDKTDNDGQKGSYSRRKVERKTKFQTDVENETSNQEYMAMVDTFVQGVIERAKEQYLSGCVNGEIELLGNGANDQCRFNKADDKTVVRDKLKKKPDNKKSDGKGKGRRKPHYKYSGPVDEKEISGYDNPEASALLNDRSMFEMEEPAATGSGNSIYQRTAALVRRLLSCCTGKT